MCIVALTYNNHSVAVLLLLLFYSKVYGSSVITWLPLQLLIFCKPFSFFHFFFAIHFHSAPSFISPERFDDITPPCENVRCASYSSVQSLSLLQALIWPQHNITSFCPLLLFTQAPLQFKSTNIPERRPCSSHCSFIWNPDLISSLRLAQVPPPPPSLPQPIVNPIALSVLSGLGAFIPCHHTVIYANFVLQIYTYISCIR